MREINPLGIRKLDVQAERRQWRREARLRAPRFCSGHLLVADEQMVRLVANALMSGWEEGVRIGAQATRDRVAEALENGKLKRQSGEAS